MNELANLLRVASAQSTKSMNTCLPGTVLSYDAGKQLASVKPMLKMRQPDGREEEIPVLNSVPVIWPRSGGASLTFPVSSGDGCLLLFSQRSIDEYKSEGKVVTPLDPRSFDLSDAVAIMGFVSFSGGGGPSDAIQLKLGDLSIVIGDGKITLNGDVRIEGNLHVEGDIDYTGEVDDLVP